MLKKIFVITFLAIFLAACVSIKTVSNVPTPQQNFVTATLAPTKTNLIYTTSTISAETHTSLSVMTVPPNCTNAAILLRDVTIPDNTQVKAGEIFTKTWEFQNTGTCLWKNYRMKFFSGESMNALPASPIPDTSPNDKVQVSVQLTAPTADGAFTASFTLNDLNGNTIPIGTEKSFWVKILVGDVAIPQNTSVPFTSIGGNTSCAYSENAGYVSELVALINQARAEANIPMLALNPQLTIAAQSHSIDMACSNSLSHTGSDGSTIGERIARTGYFITHSPSFGEIIAFDSPQDAMYQWQSDPRHWDFVLNVGNTEIGVGYAYYANSDHGGYFTVDFGSP